MRRGHVNVVGKGFFDVCASCDPEYPGVDVEFIAKDDHGVKASRPRVLFEYPNDGKLRVLVWADTNKEDYTDVIEFDLNGEAEK